MNNVIYIDFKNKKRLNSPQAQVPEPTTQTQYSDRKAAFLELMEAGMVRTVIDGNAAGVILPAEVASPQVSLNWSWKFAIPDLVINDSGISGTLSFQQVPSHVTIPWSSILAIWNLSNPVDSKVEWSPDAG